VILQQKVSHITIDPSAAVQKQPRCTTNYSPPITLVADDTPPRPELCADIQEYFRATIMKQ
jgi:hypothetical protein